MEIKSLKNNILGWKNKGFALISTVLIMSLLLVLAFAIMSLSAVTSRESKTLSHIEIAQDNARLGVMIALGQLQEYVGQDKRVTFTASIFDSDPETELIDGVHHPHWVGVAQTDRFKGESEETKIIYEGNNALFDRRYEERDLYDRKDQVLSWLVSGWNADPEVALTESDRIKLFNMDMSDGEGDVYAPLVTIEGGESKGRYAFWVSDESVKANYATFNPRKNVAPDLATAESMHSLLAPHQYGFGDVFPEMHNVDATTVEKLYSHNQIVLGEVGLSADYNSYRELGHDVTPYSRGLLVDTVNGGLKKNLTAYLDSTGSVPALEGMLGIEDNKGILLQSNREKSGPKFGSLRDWYKLKDHVSGGLYPPANGQESRVINARVPNCLEGSGVDPSNFIKQPILPVVSSAHYYGAYTYDKDTKKIIELIYPHVVLWNPYSVNLQSTGMFVEFDYKLNTIVDIRSMKGINWDWPIAPRNQVIAGVDYSLDQNKERKLIFYIPPTLFEPGQALTFTAPAPEEGAEIAPAGALFREKGWEMTENIAKANPLSSTADVTDHYCYYRTKLNDGAESIIKSRMNLSLLKMRYSGEAKDGNRPTQTINVYATKLQDPASSASDAPILAGNAPSFSDLGGLDFPKVQQIHLSPFSSKGNVRRLAHHAHYLFADVQTLFDAGTGPTVHDTAGFGVRFKHFYESYANRFFGQFNKEPWYYAPIIHSNLRAGRSHRWPSDNVFGLRTNGTGLYRRDKLPVEGLFAYGPYATQRRLEYWDDSTFVSDFQDGKYVSSVLQDNTNVSRTTMFDIPDKQLPITSLANLQHVQLTPYIWDPSYIIGSGYANPNVFLERTARTVEEEFTTWDEKVKQLTPGMGNDDVHLKSLSGDNPLIYDIAYETNHHLWDRYFLTGLSDRPAEDWPSGAWRKDAHFPNPRLKINHSVKDSDKKTILTDFHKAAQALINEGAFNTNSTSVVAWKAILSSFYTLDHPSRNGSSVDENLEHPFSRLLVPHVSGSISPEIAIPTPENDANLWGGYRKLSSYEIEALAREIVIEVKKRAPFIGLGDFVNRRLETETGVSNFGAIQAAINRSGVNGSMDALSGGALDAVDGGAERYCLPNLRKANKYWYGTEKYKSPKTTPWAGSAVAEPIPMLHKVFSWVEAYDPQLLSEAAAAPGYLTQADVLQKVGSNLTVRGDTFVIRAYGESRDSSDRVKARAWAEVVVQRTIEPIKPDEYQASLNPVDTNDSLGRKFNMISFRWLNPAEIL